jgi:hypothetical protein
MKKETDRHTYDGRKKQIDKKTEERNRQTDKKHRKKHTDRFTYKGRPKQIDKKQKQHRKKQTDRQIYLLKQTDKKTEKTDRKSSSA